MKRLIWYAIIVLLTLAALALLYTFRVAILMFVLSLAFAMFFRPMVRKLQSWGVPRILSILVPYVVGLGTVGGLIYLGAASLVMDLQTAADDFATSYSLYLIEAEDGSQLQQMIADRLPPVEALYDAVTGEQGEALATAVLGFASGLAGFISRLVIILVLSFYWSLDERRFERLWLSVLPANARTRAKEIWRGIDAGVGDYLRSEIIQSLLAAVLLTLAYRLLGLKYPSLLAVTGALAWLIPWLGAALALVAPFLVGFAASPALGIGAALVTLVVMGFLELVVEPRFFNRRRFSSILIVLMVIALADAYGLIGVLVAPPLAAAVQILASKLLSQPSSQVFPEVSAQIEMIQSRMEDLRERAGEIREEEPQVENWVRRLDGLLEKTRSELQPSEQLPVKSEQ